MYPYNIEGLLGYRFANCFCFSSLLLIIKKQYCGIFAKPHPPPPMHLLWSLSTKTALQEEAHNHGFVSSQQFTDHIYNLPCRILSLKKGTKWNTYGRVSSWWWKSERNDKKIVIIVVYIKKCLMRKTVQWLFSVQHVKARKIRSPDEWSFCLLLWKHLLLLKIVPKSASAFHFVYTVRFSPLYINSRLQEKFHDFYRRHSEQVLESNRRKQKLYFGLSSQKDSHNCESYSL